MPAFFYRFLTESALLRAGRWDVCDGESMNAAAREWDRRDAKRAAAIRARGEKGDA